MLGKCGKKAICVMCAGVMAGSLLGGCAPSKQKKEETKPQAVSEVPAETEKTETAQEAVTEKMSEKQEIVPEEVPSITVIEENSTEDGTEPFLGEIVEDEMITALREAFLDEEALLGASWAVSFEDLSTGKVTGYNEHLPLLSASVIKVFIMGTVCERVIYPESEERAIHYTSRFDGEVDGLITQMITVSDNEAANRLVEILGSGSFEEGMEVVNAFCTEHGYTETHLGRRFMGSNASGDNYASADNLRNILEDIYRGNLISEEASARMLGYLKGQTLKNKIPSGLPEGVTSANKTGEMPDGYGLGCIENDMAIVFTPKGDYILTVMANDLNGRNSEAQNMIREISSRIYEQYINN